MNRVQGKLIKLAEEASEVAKEALKAALLPGHPHEGRTPEDRLREELIDLEICKLMLIKMGVIKPIDFCDVLDAFFAKHDKIRKYTEISYGLGALNDPWVPLIQDIANGKR